MVSTNFAAIASIALAVALAPTASAFAGPTANGGGSVRSGRPTTVLRASSRESSSPRRTFLADGLAAAASLATSAALLPPEAALAAEKDSLIADLDDSLAKIRTIPSLVESAEWDRVRTVLKTPPVNELWNLGESKNTLTRLAKETGAFELLELKDELAISLQMTDQYSYDNVFIYYQPGNGKIKTKEPLEMANKAISQLKEALDVVKSS